MSHVFGKILNCIVRNFDNYILWQCLTIEILHDFD